MCEPSVHTKSVLVQNVVYNASLFPEFEDYGAIVALHYKDHGTAGILKESLALNPGETTTVKVKIQEVCGFDTYMHVHTYQVK
jgi:hypothetical protein